jgi:hypothetical protein
MSDTEGDKIVEGTSPTKGYAAPSTQMERFRKQVEDRFIDKAAPTEAKERAEQIVHRTFEATTGAPDRASDSDAIQKMREQLAAESQIESERLVHEAKTQGVSQTVMSLLQPKERSKGA